MFIRFQLVPLENLFITGDSTLAKIEPVEIDEVDVKVDMKIDLEKDSPDLNIIDKGKLHLNI